jgi:hypothetical protein
MKQLNEGTVPDELRAKAENKQLRVAVTDKQSQEYRAPTPSPPRFVAFGGKGASTSTSRGAPSTAVDIISEN